MNGRTEILLPPVLYDIILLGAAVQKHDRWTDWPSYRNTNTYLSNSLGLAQDYGQRTQRRRLSIHPLQGSSPHRASGHQSPYSRLPYPLREPQPPTSKLFFSLYSAEHCPFYVYCPAYNYNKKNNNNKMDQGQQYSLPCCTQFRFLKYVQQGRRYCSPLQSVFNFIFNVFQMRPPVCPSIIFF